MSTQSFLAKQNCEYQFLIMEKVWVLVSYKRVSYIKKSVLLYLCDGLNLIKLGIPWPDFHISWLSRDYIIARFCIAFEKHYKIAGSDHKKLYSWGCSQYRMNLVHTRERFWALKTIVLFHYFFPEWVGHVACPNAQITGKRQRNGSIVKCHV